MDGTSSAGMRLIDNLYQAIIGIRSIIGSGARFNKVKKEGGWPNGIECFT